MTTTTERLQRPLSEATQPAKTKPVKWWAAVGLASIGLIAFSWGRWLFGGHAKPTPTGPDPVPDWMVLAIRVNEAVFLVGSVLVVYWVIVKPWRRERRLTFDGMLLISLGTYWMLQDPAVNYSRILFTYNAEVIDLGCPQCYSPGWQSAGRTLPEPLLWTACWYIGFAMLVVFVGTRMLHWFRTRWPQIGKLGACIGAFAVLCVVDLLTEVLYIRLGIYVYVNVPEFGTLFPGKYYQIPIINILMAAFWWVSICAFRYFKNDRGESWAEQGITQVKATPKQRTGLRLLAMIGFVNAGLFVAYNLPVGILVTHWNNWSEDTLKRSYFRNGSCGAGTKVACYDPRVPIPVGPDSGYVTPDGVFVAPKGLPDQTRK